MVEAWLEELMVTYNQESYASRDAYTAQIHLQDFLKNGLRALQALCISHGDGHQF